MGGYITASGKKFQVDEYIEHLENRLAAIEIILGLLPSGPEWVSRSVYLAFQIAQGDRDEATDAAMLALEQVRPGQLRRFEDFARSMKDQDVAALLRPHSEVTA